MRIRRHVFVTGRVQGVGYRASTYREALKAGTPIAGFVRNLRDGRVEAVFEGEADAVLKLVEWCRRGPGSARVLRLEVMEEEVTAPELSGFEVLPDA